MKIVTYQKDLPALPAYLAAIATAPSTDANTEFTQGLGSDFVAPWKLGIEGGKFHIIDPDGNDEVATKAGEDGDQVPVTVLSVVVVASNPGKYKMFYGEQQADGTWTKLKYDPNAEAGRPACYSYDGVQPSPQAEHPQCATCAACPQNAWGSDVNDLGNKNRACSDGKILAVIPTSSITKGLTADDMGGQVFSLKLSPTSLNRSKQAKKEDPASAFSWMEFMSLLNAYPLNGVAAQIPLRAVSVKLFFNMTAKYPLLQFKLGRFLTPEEHAFALERAEGDDVKAIVEEQGQGPAPTRAPRLPAPTPAAALPAPAAKPAPAPKLPVEDDGEGEMSTASAAAPPRRGRKPKAAAEAKGAAAAAAAPTPAVKTTDAAIDEQLKSVASLFDDN